MNRMLPVIFLSFFLLSCSSQKSDSAQIKECFSNCQSAIINRNGENAIKYVSRKTVNDYDDLLEKIKHLDSPQLSKEDFSAKLFILKIRSILPPDKIRKLDKQSLLVVAIDKGISNNNNIGNCTPGEITITGSSATASLIIHNKVSPLVYSFKKENNKWKIVLRTSHYVMSYRQLFQDTAVPENEFIYNQLEQLSGRRPSNAIWHPVQ